MARYRKRPVEVDAVQLTAAADWPARQPTPAAALTAADRQFLTFALDLAADRMTDCPDEFTDADEAALETLRRHAAIEEPTP